MNLVVYGAGGMGRELMWQISSQLYNEFEVLGFIDDSLEKYNSDINGYRVIGDTKWLLNYKEPIAVVIAIGDSKTRMHVASILKKNSNIFFPNIISTNALVSDLVKLGEGNIICSNSIITVNISIGNFMLCNRSCNIGHDCDIGDYVTLNPAVSISGNVTIGECANIGTGAVVIQGKTIGKDTFIGAGAAVVNDIPAYCTAIGVPAKPVKFHIP